jgi:hypothetical protein
MAFLMHGLLGWNAVQQRCGVVAVALGQLLTALAAMI